MSARRKRAAGLHSAPVLRYDQRDTPADGETGGPMSKRTRKRRWRLKKGRANHGRRPA
ncbi:hypothetical protein GCM10009801_34780 [Streptomyces albiaxialis]|uniref:Uncharacterized protein n=1 Tax=Streptomyces albiaxialis TaxID=329523 RepID=A0ABP5HIJ6_9ACTN